MIVVAACSSEESGEHTTSTSVAPVVTGPGFLTDEQCQQAATDAVGPMQDFIDEYGALSVEAWNALDPPPDFDLLQKAVQTQAQEAANRGCDPTKLEDRLLTAVDALRGNSEVGQAIAAALRGDGPPLGPPVPIPVTTVPRETEVSSVTVEPGDDLAAVLARVAGGSTITFTAGRHTFDQTIVIDVGVNLVGEGRNATFLSSTAEGVALAFVGPGGLSIRDMTIAHAGQSGASILVAIEGPVTIADSTLTGAIAGTGDSGGGHGIVFAFEPLPGFPERTPKQREGALVVENSQVSDNDAAGILVTGTAAPTISGTTISRNGSCGICYTGSSSGTVSASTFETNPIAVQAGDTSSPTLANNVIVRNTGVGISIDGDSTAQITGNQLDGNGNIGVQITGGSQPTLEHNTVTNHGVGVLATDTSASALRENTINNDDVGIQVVGEAAVEAIDNTLWVSAVAAVSYGDASTGTIRGNHIAAAAVAGIQVTGSASPDVIGNEVIGSGEVGISFVGTATGSAKDNQVIDRDVGIQVGGAAAPHLTGNIVTGSVAVGILFGDESAGIATNNHLSGADSVGILVGGHSAPTVTENTMTDNSVGLVFRETARGLARGNTITRHVTGVQIVDQATPTLDGNTITESTEAGIVFGGSAAGRFLRNTVANNGSIGLQVGESAHPEIAGNEIRGPGVYGMLFRDSGAGRASENLLVDHVFGIQLGDSAAPDLVSNTLEEIVLTGIVYADSTAGSAIGNRCSSSTAAGISVSAPADPVLTDNECSVSRTG